MNRLDDHANDVMEKLALLEPTTADMPKLAGPALAAFKQQLRPTPSPLATFFRSIVMTQNRKIAASLASFVFIFALALSFPAVRVAANDFLGLFRVQKFAAVSISPDQVALLREVAASGLVPGKLVVTDEASESQTAVSIANAEEITGLNVRTLPTLADPTSIVVQGGSNGRLIIDAAQSQEILKLAGADPRLMPNSLDGAEIAISVFTSIEQVWADGTFLVQTASPVVAYPEGFDPLPLGEALLQLLGMSASEASRLARSIDWTGTLLLPVPQNVATFAEIVVGNDTGLALSSLDGSENALMWQSGGVVYILRSPSSTTAELVALASTLQ